MSATRQPAIVLRTRPLGEADLVVVLLARDAGKVASAARSARRSRRRFCGGLPVGAVGHAELARGRGSLWRLSGFTPEADHGVFGRDLDRFAQVAYLCELTDELVWEHEPMPELLAALTLAVRHLRSHGPAPLVLRRYELVLLDCLGLLPALDGCAVCGTALATAAAGGFDVRRGGLLCESHGRGAPPVPAAGLALALALGAGRPASQAVPSDLPEPSSEARRELRDLLQDALRAHLRRPLRALAFFRKLHGAGHG